jgi:queuosine precursor transporter
MLTRKDRRSRAPKRAGILAVAYITTILLSNWAISRFGVVPVGFGLMAPAGVYFVGVAFTLRDLLQDRAGKSVVLASILGGAAMSGVVSTGFALASAVAFLVSEFADFAVYTPLRRRGWLTAVVLSNVVGLLVDSMLFLWLAFGSLTFFPGQVLGKAWMTAAAVAVLMVVRGRPSRQRTRAEQQAKVLAG